MTLLQAMAFLFVAAGATIVVLTRDPLRQVLAFALYGLFLTLLFLFLQAPDVALSELAIGTAALPLILLVTLAKLRETKHE
jgi:energy-converting hydrogenase B subunit D